MNPLRHLVDPVYVLRPTQVVRRFVNAYRGKQTEIVDARTAWGDVLKVRRTDTIGQAIRNRGVHDLDVVEACWRLARPETLSIDAGANVGSVSSALARSTGHTGRILAYEPHPDLLPLLAVNVASFATTGRSAPITVRNVALGPSPGPARLHIPEDWDENAGRASLAATFGGRSFDVPVCTLDDEIGSQSIQVLKLDVEGFEDAVLAGATGLLARGAIRHIVFEDFDVDHSPVKARLVGAGYHVLSLQATFRGLRLVEPGTTEVYNHVATLDVGECVSAFRAPGWRCLST